MELKGKLTAGEKVGKRRRKESGRRWEEDTEGEEGVRKMRKERERKRGRRNIREGEREDG